VAVRRRTAGPVPWLVALLFLVVPLAPVSAQVLSIGLSVSPSFPVLVTVGQTDQPASMTITNATSTGAGPITLTEIALNPACGSLSLDCLPPDPGVFALSATGAGTSGACAGRIFVITAPDANGRSLFVPTGGALALAQPGQVNSTCTIAFTFSVLKAPTVDAQPAAGLQTAHVARVTGTAQFGDGFTGTGTARGLQTSNVSRATPTLAAQASPPVASGGTVSDAVTLSGPVAITGSVTFTLYGPSDPACQGPALSTSTKPVVSNAATSDPVVASQVGTYRFVASYSGDANNAPVTTACVDPAQAVVVAQDGGRYRPLTPVRILDTRTGTGGITVPVGPGATIDLQVTGQGGVPVSGVSAVAVNITVTQPTGDGYLTAYPTGTPRPVVSNLNFTPGDTVPNLAVLRLGTGGRVSLFNSTGSSHVIVDVTGWYSDAGAGNEGRYQSLVPSRVLDTRLGIGGGARLGPGASLDVQITGRGGVPDSGVSAAVLNVTATDPSGTSFLTVHPTGEARPLASNLNFDAGETVANRVMGKLGTGGRVTIFNGSGSVEVIVDVGGWYTDASIAGITGSYTSLAPVRIVDTRLGVGGLTGPVGGGTTFAMQVAGGGGVPASGVRAVVLNVTAVQPAGSGYLTLYPTGVAQPNASDMNFGPGQTRANLVVVRVGADGKVNVFSSVATHFLFDVAGWYT
jgi:hypothetical protein